MIADGIEIIKMILPAFVLITAGFFVGVVAEKIIFKKLRKIALRTRWDGGEIIITAIHGMIMFWCVLAGMYGAINTISLSDHLFGFFQKSLLVVVIATVTAALAKAAAGFVDLYSRRAEGILSSISIFSNITKLSIYVLGLLVVLQSLGISIAPILTALGVGGLAVALALQDTLANLFAGLHVLVSRQVKQGHYIKLNTGEEGYVTDITWRNTTIRALANNMIIIPNAKLAAAIITNYNLPAKEVSVSIPVAVSYTSDLAKVEKITLEVAREVMKGTASAVPEFEPVLRYQSFGDPGIGFGVVLLVREFADQFLIRHEFIKRLHERYLAEGIEIPLPAGPAGLQEAKRDLSKN